MLRGWEMDETIEVGAHRETFEEAGILGTLGPRLTEVDYETRKGKKRRLELESLAKLKHGLLLRSGSSASASFVSEDEATDDIAILVSNSPAAAVDIEDRTLISSNKLDDVQDSTCGISTAFDGEKPKKNNVVDDSNNSSPVVDSRSSCTHVRMCMFVMYVTDVKDQWPECERVRTVMDIDEAIDATSNRPEFQTILLEVKRNGYHLNVPTNIKVNSAEINVLKM
jgi:ADP-ribose pyrophosphatase YjhB (NUDIX family)